MKLEKGTLLLAEPFMKDPNFKRSVVLLCEHSEEGTMGFTLSRPVGIALNKVIDGVGDCELPLYFGGPVQRDTLHFIHDMGDLIKDSTEVADGIYWGGDFEQVKLLAATGQLDDANILFFLGYSGWSAGQLSEEMGDNSWITHKAAGDLIFVDQQEELWKQALKHMGGDYALMVNFPEDPTLN